MQGSCSAHRRCTHESLVHVFCKSLRRSRPLPAARGLVALVGTVQGVIKAVLFHMCGQMRYVGASTCHGARMACEYKGQRQKLLARVKYVQLLKPVALGLCCKGLHGRYVVAVTAKKGIVALIRAMPLLRSSCRRHAVRACAGTSGVSLVS